MNKPELLTSIAKKSGLTKGEAERALEGLISTITDELTAGRELRIVDLGKFEVAQRKAQQGRNPRTGDPITIPERKIVRFKSAKALKDAVQ